MFWASSARTPAVSCWASASYPRRKSSGFGSGMVCVLGGWPTMADPLGRSLGGGYPGLFRAERAGELRPSGDPELCVAAREMSLDGFQGDIQPLRDFAVGLPLGGQPRDPQLAGGERVDPGTPLATRASARGLQLLTHPRGERTRAATGGQV